MSVIVKYQTINFTMTRVPNCYDLLLTSSVPDDGKRTNLHNSGANIVHNLYPEFFLHFQKQWEDSVMALIET